MQACSRGIQEQLHPVIHNGKLQLVHTTRLRKPLQAIVLPQALGGSLLDDGLAVRDAAQLRIQAVALDGKLAILGNKLFQRRCQDPLEQFLKAAGLKRSQPQQHPLAGAQADIGPNHCPLIAGAQHPAVFHLYVFHIHTAQLIACQALQAKQTGHRKLHLIHNYLRPNGHKHHFLCHYNVKSMK